MLPWSADAVWCRVLKCSVAARPRCRSRSWACCRRRRRRSTVAPPPAGRVLYVRNLPFNISAEEVRTPRRLRGAAARGVQRMGGHCSPADSRRPAAGAPSAPPHHHHHFQPSARPSHPTDVRLVWQVRRDPPDPCGQQQGDARHGVHCVRRHLRRKDGGGPPVRVQRAGAPGCGCRTRSSAVCGRFRSLCWPRWVVVLRGEDGGEPPVGV